MKESLTTLCENFLESRETIYKQKGFKLTNSKLMAICAYIYASSGKTVDPDQLQDCLKLVEKNGGGIFSIFRNSLKAPLACTLAVSNDPEGMMNITFDNFTELKKVYRENRYLGIAALLLQKEENDSKINRGKVIYDCLKNRHKINTNDHDTLMTNILAYSDKPVEAIMEEVEKIYTELKPMTRGEYAQTCALILTCSDKPADEKCARVKELYEALQADKKNKYSNGPEIAVLSALSLLDIDFRTLTSDILELSKFLAEKKPYKGVLTTYGKYERMMHAAMLIMADNMTAEINVLAAAAIYLSCFYLYEIEQDAATASATMSMST